MASVSMAMPLPTAAKKRLQPTSPEAFFSPLAVKRSRPIRGNSKSKLRVEASLKESATAGITAAAVVASMVIPEVALAADSMTPSLKNFLLSIGAGGAVLVAIAGAVIGVSNFDPVKRS